MLRPAFYVLLLLGLLASLVAPQPSGNCSTVPAITLRRGGSEYVIQGPKASAYPLKGDSTRLPNITLTLELSLFLERAKTWVSSTKFGNYADYVSPDPNTPKTLIKKALGAPCNDPAQPCFVDPFHVTTEDEEDCPGTRFPCGAVLQHVYVSELDCYQQHVIVDDFHGTRRESVITVYSYPGDPAILGQKANTRFLTEYHLVDDPVSFWGNSDGLKEHYVYEPQRLKISYQILDWPWIGDNSTTPPGGWFNNASGIDLWANLTLDVGVPTTAYIERTERNKTFDFFGMDGRLKIMAFLSTIIVLDDYGIGLNETDIGLVPPVEIPPITASSQMRWTVKPSVTGHWTKMDYDPTLATIFTPDVTPGSTKSSRTVALAVGLSIGLVALLVVVVILLFLFSLSVRRAVSPYRARSERRNESSNLAPTTQAASASQSWAKGSTPHS